MTKGLHKIACILLGVAVLSLSGLALAQPMGDTPPPPDCKDMQKPPPDRERHLQDNIKKLVEDGTINQQQADKVISFFKEKDRERQSDLEKMKTMTPEERNTFMEQKKGHRPDIIGDLIKYADLSESQAKSVADALRPPAPPSPGAPKH